MHKQHIFCTKKHALEGNPPACHEDQKLFVREACKPSSVIGGHLSRPIVTGGFKRNPESSTGRLKRSFVSCCGWGLHRGQVAMPRVSSYLTFPPLHAQSACGISLLHFPWGRPRRVLPGTLPCAARTFLTPFGARPPGSLTNAEIIALILCFVNDGSAQPEKAALRQSHAHPADECAQCIAIWKRAQPSQIADGPAPHVG